MKTPFKSIHLNSCFDFDHSDIPHWSGAVGPWRKISPRKYVKLSDPSAVHRVGTVNVAVIPRLDLNAGIKGA